MRTIRNSSRTSGFTLIELSISTVILAVVGYSVSIAVKMGNDSNSTVMQVASDSRTERKTMSALMDDVRMSSNARITATTDLHGNSLVQIQQPIEVDGGFVWGVRDRRLGGDEASWNQENWTIRYAVDANGRLVRRIVDTNDVTRLEDVLADDVIDGGGGATGFRVVRSGDVWQVNVATRRGASGEVVSETEFHVRTRN